MCSPCSVLMLSPTPHGSSGCDCGCVCECACSARPCAYSHSETEREDGKCGYKILHTGILSWAYRAPGAPSPTCIYRTPEPVGRTRPELCRYEGEENRESLEGLPLGRPAGALSQNLKVRGSRIQERKSCRGRLIPPFGLNADPPSFLPPTGLQTPVPWSAWCTWPALSGLLPPGSACCPPPGPQFQEYAANPHPSCYGTATQAVLWALGLGGLSL